MRAATIYTEREVHELLVEFAGYSIEPPCAYVYMPGENHIRIPLHIINENEVILDFENAYVGATLADADKAVAWLKRQV